MAHAAWAQTNAETLYREAVRREALLRKQIDDRESQSASEPLLERARTLAQTYEQIARLFPRSGYGDNALWQGAVLAGDTFWEFGQAADRARALRLFRALVSGYPASSLRKQVPAQTARLKAAETTARAGSTPPAPVTAPASVLPRGASTTLTAVRREVLPDALRVTLELDGEVAFYDERIEGPPRVFVDLHNARAIATLTEAALDFRDDVVRRIRVGRQQDARTRVVLEIQNAARHSVYALYNPYRIVLDFERAAPTSEAKLAPTHVRGRAPTSARKLAPASESVVKPPSRNAAGGFSLSRQLGLGVGRIVIDPGHGGHDPGAEVRGLNEAGLTLDVALRLEKLLLKQPGVEVVLTRRTDAYVPLDERTAIANRAAADLFLSIHANASGNTRARGIETYFLNFASNSAAEALAARENAGSSRTMRELPDIVKAIALDNKLDESRDFATFVQGSMYDKLRRVNPLARNLGVKQAPFLVLIGATMPSILVEISFLTNRQEATLLRTAKYREQIADALLTGVMKYQRSLKRSGTVAAR
jgi:N-acetylmuramoyl-L-alanine amidase